jgi:signal transduction histidine kinase
LPKDSLIYIERAKDGINRLNTIFTRLSEATRLEQALQTAERELFNLTKLVTSCLEGYRLAYPKQQFIADMSPRPIVFDGAPDLIAQMLDKLIANAVDFAEPNTPITVQLFQEKQTIRLSVMNQGMPLPGGMTERLFESMVSLRPQSIPQKEPHLGLGLYIVRLIAGYHGGQVKAVDMGQPPGATFTALLPTRFNEIVS